MSDIQRGTDSKPLLILPSNLDLTAAPALKADLQTLLALAEGADIDGQNVQRVTSPCLQVLVSAAGAFAQAGGPRMQLSKMSDPLSEAVWGLGLGQALGLSGDRHA